jgi:uncharacterized protein (TIGR02646 family)
MIHVDRSAVREPKGLKRLRDAGLKHAKRFFIDTPVQERRQTRYFNPYWQKAYRVPIPALVELFHGKCAYCESKVNADAPGVLDHFRPKWATRGLREEYAPDHYWWLAFAWSNLYLTCPNCNKQRGPRFPVKGARINGPDDDPATEDALLLDPCGPIDPDEHLRFDESGRVSPLSTQGDVSINLFGLNRTALLTGRKRVVKELKSVWQEAMLARPNVPQTIINRLNEFTTHDAEFSACATQILRRWLSRVDRRRLKGLALEPVSKHEHKRVVQSHTAEIAPRFIDEIRVTNFRGISSLTLRAPSSDQSSMDWFMLIGENAAGKSSILQAIALNLMSQADRSRLGFSPQPFIKRGTSTARVEIRFRNDDRPRVLTITQRSRFKATSPAAGAPLMAYGATRLPPLARMPARRTSLENLFNPFAPLLDPVAWLLKLGKSRKRADRADFDYAARALAALLPGRPKKWRFRASGNDVIVDPEGPLRQLSDGYQSVIALAADIMATVHHSFRGGMEAAEGIVLLDELGAHLHPRWKMRLTKVLRRAFPRLQFIVTTHDPLCLRGLRNGEVATIEKTARGRVFARTDLPAIEGMRVDQILQSEYFGLRSAMDPDIEARFDRMYRLKAKPPKTLTPKQRKDLAKLEQELVRYTVPGSTRAERLMLTEINTYLAREREEPVKKKRDDAWAAAQTQIAKRIEKELGIAL